MAVSRHPNGACSTLIAALTLCLLSMGPHKRSCFGLTPGPGAGTIMGRLGHITTGRGGGAITSRLGKGANARTKATNRGRNLILLNQKKARRLAINKPLILCAIRISARGGLRWVCAQLRIRNCGLWLMSRG